MKFPLALIKMRWQLKQKGQMEMEQAQYEQNTQSTLHFSRETIQKIAQDKMSSSHFAKIFLRQAWSENRFLFKKRVNFRKRENRKAVQAYCEMSLKDFEGINARQQWANWRTIPKNLSGALPDYPMFAIDLCCGVGHSTEVLACYLPPGSQILGYEFNPSFVKKAGLKKYFHMKGQLCRVKFKTQSVLEIFRDEKGERIPDRSVDLVNSSGAVGCHFDSETTEVLSKEVARVLKPGGLALIDSGLPGTPKDQLIRIFESQGFETRNFAKSCLFDLYTQVCFCKTR